VSSRKLTNRFPIGSEVGVHDIALDSHPSTLLAEAANRRRFTNRLDPSERPSSPRHENGLGRPLRLAQQGDAVGFERRQNDGLHASIIQGQMDQETGVNAG